MSSDRATLVPEYHQVEQFGADDEYERDENGEIIEEVEYVTLDVGVVEPTLVPSTSAYRLIGLDTPTPYLQLSGTIFKGSHQELLGTELLFTDAKEGSDPTKKSLVHIGNTEKRIRFREVELKEKKPEPPQGQVDLSQYEQTSVSSSSKKRKPQSVDEIVGNVSLEETPAKGRGRRGRKPKGKERETEPSEGVQAEETTEAPPAPGDADVASAVLEAPAEAAAEPMDTTEG